MHLSASAIRDGVAAGKMSASAVAKGAISAIRSDDARIKAFLHVDEEGATAAAKALNTSGLLAGVPIAIKDNLCQRGVPTTASSKILAGFRPPYTATVVERLLAAGAIPVGKTNLDEFAMGSSTENSAFGPSRNPWDVTRTPGGSSGGSAAAVAARMVPVALGSDTGGSIRQPAALCGIVGLKPTYGRVSRYGLIAFASSLDQVGPLSLTVADSARVLGVIAGHDPLDATSSPRPVPDYLATLENGVKGLRLGIPREFFAAGLDPAIETCVREAIAVLEHAGATLVPIRLPHTEFGIAAYYVIAPCEASSNLARFDGVRYGHRTAASGNLLEMFRKSRTEGFGEEVRRRIMLGTFALSSGYYDAYYKKALQVRALIKRDFDEAFKSVDAIVGPTSPIPAFKLGEKVADPIAMYLCDVLTVTANLAGIPGISVPCGFTPAGLPAGLQILGRDWDEAGILRIARAYERETDWSQKEPTR